MRITSNVSRIVDASVIGGVGEKSDFDVIVCGSGSAGSVIARRLSDNPDVRVLLVEAGGEDNIASVTEAARWSENLGTERDWGFTAEPNPSVNGRQIGMSMGKVLGGGSSINVMLWARGHKSDWDHFAKEAGDAAWSYEAILGIYRRIENWQGRKDERRGVDGLVTVGQASNPHPVASAMVEAAATVGISSYDSPNGAMMEAAKGAAFADWRLQDGKRLSVFGSYVRPVLGRSNLTILTRALVYRVLFDRTCAVGVDLLIGGALHRVTAAEHVILSTGAINTPRILMQSGIGDQEELKRLNIPVLQHLPGVGQNLQDHACFGVVWEAREAVVPNGNGSGAALFSTSNAGMDSPDILMCSAEFPHCSSDVARRGVPANAWSLVVGLARPKSRGRVRLRSSDPLDPVAIHLNTLSDPNDLVVARAAIDLSRQIGASKPFGPLGVREAIPGRMSMTDMDDFIRDSAMPFWHQSCTAKMGRDPLSVVDSNLAVYGVTGLTIADGSIMPRITSGNTMAPCVVIGERASEILQRSLTNSSSVENGDPIP